MACGTSNSLFVRVLLLSLTQQHKQQYAKCNHSIFNAFMYIFLDRVGICVASSAPNVEEIHIFRSNDDSKLVGVNKIMFGFWM